MKYKALMIVGPTAVGKTALSIKLAQQYNGEVISGDSMQIYRHLDIGTAKITPSEMAGIPHYLIDICDVSQRYTVHDFKEQANQLIVEMNQRHKLPIIVGGTGFYLNTLRCNFNLGDEQETNYSVQSREKWTTYYETAGPEAAWLKLKQQDPVSADKIPMTNKRRMIRALEVVNETGQPFSKQVQEASNLDCCIIGLNTERSFLYDRINQRVRQFMDAGLETEARWLYQRRASSVQASQGIGYKELFPYFDGIATREECIAMIQRNSRRFAKRQLTYFRNQMPVNWYDPFEEKGWYDKASEQVAHWLD